MSSVYEFCICCRQLVFICVFRIQEGSCLPNIVINCRKEEKKEFQQKTSYCRIWRIEQSSFVQSEVTDRSKWGSHVVYSESLNVPLQEMKWITLQFYKHRQHMRLYWKYRSLKCPHNPYCRHCNQQVCNLLPGVIVGIVMLEDVSLESMSQECPAVMLNGSPADCDPNLLLWWHFLWYLVKLFIMKLQSWKKCAHLISYSLY